MNIKVPPYQRKGQAIFNFLEWLRLEKGFKTEKNNRMADPFYLSDDEFDNYYEEFLNKDI